MDSDSSTVLRTSGLTKRYPSGSGEITVLAGLDLEISRGERLALTGESGAGKTTLLYLLGGLDRPTSGKIFFGSIEMTSLNGDALGDLRNRKLAFVWQQSSLLPEFTALENVSMPLRIRGVSGTDAERRAKDRLAEVGLAGELSGGEQQRVALARALVTDPEVLLADEPTGNLDNQTGEKIISLIEELHVRHGLTSVIVTHNQAFAARCDRVLELREAHFAGATMKGRSYV
jgi:lipoprotein-releasing system ATP-binding protein